MQTTYVLLKIEHSKPIDALTDISASRVYTLNNVDDVTASLVTPVDMFGMAGKVYLSHDRDWEKKIGA